MRRSLRCCRGMEKRRAPFEPCHNFKFSSQISILIRSAFDPTTDLLLLLLYVVACPDSPMIYWNAAANKGPYIRGIQNGVWKHRTTTKTTETTIIIFIKVFHSKFHMCSVSETIINVCECVIENCLPVPFFLHVFWVWSGPVQSTATGFFHPPTLAAASAEVWRRRQGGFTIQNGQHCHRA